MSRRRFLSNGAAFAASAGVPGAGLIKLSSGMTAISSLPTRLSSSFSLEGFRNALKKVNYSITFLKRDSDAIAGFSLGNCPSAEDLLGIRSNILCTLQNSSLAHLRFMPGFTNAIELFLERYPKEADISFGMRTPADVVATHEAFIARASLLARKVESLIPRDARPDFGEPCLDTISMAATDNNNIVPWLDIDRVSMTPQALRLYEESSFMMSRHHRSGYWRFPLPIERYYADAEASPLLRHPLIHTEHEYPDHRARFLGIDEPLFDLDLSRLSVQRAEDTIESIVRLPWNFCFPAGFSVDKAYLFVHSRSASSSSLLEKLKREGSVDFEPEKMDDVLNFNDFEKAILDPHVLFEATDNPCIYQVTTLSNAKMTILEIGDFAKKTLSTRAKIELKGPDRIQISLEPESHMDIALCTLWSEVNRSLRVELESSLEEQKYAAPAEGHHAEMI